MEPSAQRTKFTKYEDVKLRRIVASMPKPDWKLVGSLMGNRTARQCRERYNNYLAPTVNNEPWTKEEEELLLEKYEELGPQWSKMTQFFDNRASVSIKNHYAKMTLRKKRSDARGETDEPKPEGDIPPPPPPPVRPRDGRIAQAVTKLFHDADTMGEAWYSAESEAKFASVVHLPQVD